MPSQGPNSPVGWGTDSSVGTVNWNFPHNIIAQDFNYSSANTGTSIYLMGDDYGFSIPEGMSIDGVIVEIYRRAASASAKSDNSIRLVVGGVIVGDNKAAAGFWSTTAAYFTYGGESDLWGTSLTREQVNASDFGVVLSATGSNFGFVDHMRMTVHYSEGGGDSVSQSKNSINVGVSL